VEHGMTSVQAVHVGRGSAGSDDHDLRRVLKAK
jgi:hypothetical protein